MSTTTASPEGSSLSSDPDVTRDVEQNDAGPLRMKFEAWFSSDGMWPASIECSRSGGYRLSSAAMAWRAWQACTKATAAPELLAALQVADLYVNGGKHWTEAGYEEDCRKVRAAIAKATGAAS